MTIVMPLSEETAKVGKYDITYVEMNVNLKDTTDLSEAEKSISGYHQDEFGTYWYVDGVCFTFYGDEYL